MNRTSGSETPARFPWYLTAVLFASTSVIVGIIWDISWHRTIGRDTFWTPAHLAIYAGGLAAGLSCGWLALKTTFSGSETEVGRSVRMWGFRAPLGAWVAIWGAIAMLTSAPLDDWWHNAYGLDVQILSPPHVVLALGISSIQFGALLMALSWQNRASEGGRRRLGLAYAYSAGLLLLNTSVLMMEYSMPNDWHGPVFYMISAGVYPLVLFAVARAGRLRWPATWAAVVYMGMTLVMMWVLPLFPAEPLLAPILRNVDRMVPPEFPLLLVVPAIALDMLLRRASRPGQAPARRSVDWGLAALGSVVFVGIFGVVHWYFGEFMLSEASRNYVFQGDTWGYFNRPGPWQYEFWSGSRFWSRVWWALPIGFASARAGLWVGNWMLAVRR
jgi:hypothetical protein